MVCCFYFLLRSARAETLKSTKKAENTHRTYIGSSYHKILVWSQTTALLSSGKAGCWFSNVLHQACKCLKLQGRDLSFQKQMTTLKLYMETDDYVSYGFIMCLICGKMIYVYRYLSDQKQILMKIYHENQSVFRTHSYTYKLYCLRFTWLVAIAMKMTYISTTVW